MEARYGISIYPGTGTANGKSGDHVLICPPYNINESDVESIVDLSSKVIEDYFESIA